jgi:hypothetical protein
MSNKRKFNDFDTPPNKFLKTEYDYIYDEIFSLKQQLIIINNNLQIIHKHMSLLNTLINFKLNYITNNHLSIPSRTYEYYG